jgi:hypothetical protein
MRIMRKIKPALAALIVVIGAGAGHQALAASGNTSVSTGSASATVAAPIRLVATGPLRFGTIAQPQVGGTMTVSPYSAVSTTGDIGSDSAIAQTAPPAAASFSVTGIPGMQFTASGVSQVIISNGSATMTVGQFTINSSFSGGQISANGTTTFNIGGTLTASAGQAVGIYAGSFPITVTYY